MDELKQEGNPDQYSLELYKNLRAEVVTYMSRVPGLWLQKFLLVGGVIAFSLAGDIGADYKRLSFIGGLSVIPILAVLLDAKMLEYGLHARAISLFIAERYTSPVVIPEWERLLWGEGQEGLPRRLTRVRSFVTLLVTVAPTIAIIVLSGALLESMSEIKYASILSVALGGAYLIGSVIIWGVMGPRSKKNNPAQPIS